MDVVTLAAAKAAAAPKAGPVPRIYQRRHIAVSDNAYGAGTSANSQAATTPGYTTRRPHLIGNDATDIRLVFTNAYVNASASFVDTDNANTLTVKAAIEVSGTVYQLTFGGQKTGTVDGGGVLISDPVAVEVAAGSTIYSRTNVVGTTYYPNHAAFTGALFGGRVAGDSAYSGTVADSGAYMYGPAAILGTTSDPKVALLVIGDSIADGVGDRTGGSHGGTGSAGKGGGFVQRGMRSTVGLLSLAQSSELASQFGPQAGHTRRMALSQFCTHAIVQYGRNDLSASHNLATCQADLITVWNLCKRRGLKAAQVTVTPTSSSTDGFSTTGNQSPSAFESVRTSLNDWLRDGAPMVSGAAVAVGTVGASRCAYYSATDTLVTGASGATHPLVAVLEVADTVESARNSSKWKVTGRAVADVTATASSQTITSATAAFTAADVGTSIWIAGAGTAGAALQTYIATVTNGTTAAMDNAAVTTVSNAVANIGGATLDGTHPTPTMHASMGTALPKNWLLL